MSCNDQDQVNSIEAFKSLLVAYEDAFLALVFAYSTLGRLTSRFEEACDEQRKAILTLEGLKTYASSRSDDSLKCLAYEASGHEVRKSFLALVESKEIAAKAKAALDAAKAKLPADMVGL